MVMYHRGQSRTALLLALAMTATAAIPYLKVTPATAGFPPEVVAQLFPTQPTQVTPQSPRVSVPSGTVIPVNSKEAEKIVVMPDETLSMTLTVARDIRSSTGTVLVPVGSTIEGELQPVEGGTQFVAQYLRIKNSNRQLPIDATSEVITETETLDQGTDVGRILQNAAIGAAAAAVLSEVFGGIEFLEVLTGAGLGALSGWLLGGRKTVDVVVIYPETDLDVILESDLVLD